MARTTPKVCIRLLIVCLCTKGCFSSWCTFQKMLYFSQKEIPTLHITLYSMKTIFAIMFNSEARWDCYVCGCDVTLCCLGAQTDVTVRSLTCHAAVATGHWSRVSNVYARRLFVILTLTRRPFIESYLSFSPFSLSLSSAGSSVTLTTSLDSQL